MYVRHLRTHDARFVDVSSVALAPAIAADETAGAGGGAVAVEGDGDV